MSDNEHTAPSLWDGTSVSVHSDELSVQHSVGPPIPEFCQPPEDGSKIPSSVIRQDTGHVLPNQPPGPQSLSKPKKLEREVATRSVQARSQSGDAEVLAGGATHEKIDSCVEIA